MALGFGDKLVTCTAQDIDWLQSLHAKCHEGKSRHAAQNENAVGPGFLHGIDCRRKPALPFHRWSASGDGFDAGNFGRNNTHLSRSKHRISTARNIAAYRVHRNVLVSQNDAGTDFHLQWNECLELRLRKAADISQAIISVANELFRDSGDDLTNLVFSQFEARRRPLVELLTVLPDGIHAIAFQIR